jgi:hypothetical protein
VGQKIVDTLSGLKRELDRDAYGKLFNLLKDSKLDYV